MSRVHGLPALIKSLRATQVRHGRGIARGLKLGGIEILRASQKIVPVDLGTLKATGHVRHEGEGFDTVVIIAYGTDYAAYVHEEMDKAHGEAYNIKYAEQIRRRERYWYRGAMRTYHKRKPAEQAKFLERATRENAGRVAAIVRTEAAR